MKLTDFDYELPEELIAQEPAAARADARMMVVRRSTGQFEHTHVSSLPVFLAPEDLLVLNDTRVMSARVYGRKVDTGGKVELLFLEPAGGPREWEALIRASRPAQVGTRLTLADGGISCTVSAVGDRGRIHVVVDGDADVVDLLNQHGIMPLPPYIGREASGREVDRERYQTVYSREPGAVAAPTAGLHFTDALLGEIASRGVARSQVTLHVGWGTFRPVTAETISDHQIHSERYELSAEAAQAVNAARARQGRVVAVGTTTVRTLETVAQVAMPMAASRGRSEIFIYPPYAFRAVDAMLTNFHLPRSSLLMLVSAFLGHALMREVYATAVAKRYRFYSYGDCMLLLP